MKPRHTNGEKPIILGEGVFQMIRRMNNAMI